MHGYILKLVVLQSLIIFMRLRLRESRPGQEPSLVVRMTIRQSAGQPAGRCKHETMCVLDFSCLPVISCSPDSVLFNRYAYGEGKLLS
jgi:hypothetical protein